MLKNLTKTLISQLSDSSLQGRMLADWRGRLCLQGLGLSGDCLQACLLQAMRAAGGHAEWSVHDLEQPWNDPMVQNSS